MPQRSRPSAALLALLIVSQGCFLLLAASVSSDASSSGDASGSGDGSSSSVGNVAGPADESAALEALLGALQRPSGSQAPPESAVALQPAAADDPQLQQASGSGTPLCVAPPGAFDAFDAPPPAAAAGPAATSPQLQEQQQQQEPPPPPRFEPACDDADANDTAAHCAQYLPSGAWQEGGAGNSSSGNSSSSSSSSSGGKTPPTPTFSSATAGGGDGNAPAAGAASSADECTRSFTRIGSAPRSAAIVLLRWSRAHYRRRADCCPTPAADGADCDCTWPGGVTYGALPPLSAYSRLFTDECADQPGEARRPSVNRAYYDASGGRVSFHSRLVVPTPATNAAEGDPPGGPGGVVVTVAGGGSNATTGAGGGNAPGQPAADAAADAAAQDPQQPPPQQQPPPPPPLPTEPVSTPTSFLDPLGVDVYGVATLERMRGAGPDGAACADACGEAMRQLNVSGGGYNHVVCMLLYDDSEWLYGGDARAECPGDLGLGRDCGCGNEPAKRVYGEFYSLGGCLVPGPPGLKTWMPMPTRTYAASAASAAQQQQAKQPSAAAAANATAEDGGGGGADGSSGSSTPPAANSQGNGSFIVSTPSLRAYLSHELGHNLGLAHAGSLRCQVDQGDGRVARDPALCVHDEYGDGGSVMGFTATLSHPVAYKLKLGWLPRSTVKSHPRGIEARYTLRPTTSRRPSWQRSAGPDARAAAASASPQQRPVRWFDGNTTLAVRISLPSRAGPAATAGYECPCAACGGGGPCDVPSCTAEACADAGMDFLMVEAQQFYLDDEPPRNQGPGRGVAVRLVHRKACSGARLVPTHAVDDGSGKKVAKYLLDTPDPAGVLPGSAFVDDLRGVRVVLESFERTVAVVRISAT